jgi:hypothetical protein
LLFENHVDRPINTPTDMNRRRGPPGLPCPARRGPEDGGGGRRAGGGAADAPPLRPRGRVAIGMTFVVHVVGISVPTHRPPNTIPNRPIPAPPKKRRSVRPTARSCPCTSNSRAAATAAACGRSRTGRKFN